jgi:hypothetical protein
MVKILKGIADAVLRFILVGIVFPLAIQYFNPVISNYVSLPPSNEIWLVMILFGALFAVTGFLQNAYVKGEFPWLFGKIGGGIATMGFFSYLLLFLPNVAGDGVVHASGLVVLIFLAVAFSYLYLVFDFWDARRSLRKKAQQQSAKSDSQTQLEQGTTLAE